MRRCLTIATILAWSWTGGPIAGCSHGAVDPAETPTPALTYRDFDVVIASHAHIIA